MFVVNENEMHFFLYQKNKRKYIVYEQQTSYSEFIYFALDEIANNLVVEVFYRSPLDALLHILLLQDMEKKRE